VRIETAHLDSHLLMANRSSLHLVILNLVSNAVKFVSPQVRPHIRIWCEKNGEFVRLWVQDNGIGIAQEDLSKLFTAFKRLHSNADYAGTGLGLALVKKAVERMGGRVGVESQLGHGSRFWMDLRLGTSTRSEETSEKQSAPCDVSLAGF
jgi:signal transduction histidine kinase